MNMIEQTAFTLPMISKLKRVPKLANIDLTNGRPGPVMIRDIYFLPNSRPHY